MIGSLPLVSQKNLLAITPTISELCKMIQAEKKKRQLVKDELNLWKLHGFIE